jgi:HEAT repeat protein
MANQAWRVREMGARVAAARKLQLSAAVGGLLTDEVARVRATAARSLGDLGTLEDVDALRPLLKDPEIDVRRGAQQGIDALRKRFPAA